MSFLKRSASDVQDLPMANLASESGPSATNAPSPIKPLSMVYLELEGNVTDEVLGEYATVIEQLNGISRKTQAQKDFIKDGLATMNRVLDDRIKRPKPSNIAPELVSLPVTTKTTIKLNELVIRPETFDGIRPKPRRWLEDYNEAIIANGWDDYIAVKYFPTFLEMAAKDWYVTDVRPRLSNLTKWLDIHRWFSQNFLGESDYEQLSQAVDNIKQKMGESVSTFIPRVRRLMLMLTPDLPEGEQIRQIRSKLRPEYKPLLAFSVPTSIQHLKEICLKIEAGFSRARIDDPRTSADSSKFKRGNHGDRYTRNKQHESRSSKNTKIENRQCYKCDRSGHLARDCFASHKKDGTPIPRDETRTSKKVNMVEKPSSGEDECDSDNEIVTIEHACNSIGGKSLDDVDTKVEVVRKPSTRQNKVLSVSGGDKLLEQTLKCNDKPLLAIVDTGAYATVLNDEVVKRYGWKLEGPTTPLVGADGSYLKMSGVTTIKVEMTIGRFTKSKIVKVAVMKNLTSEMLLGLELMRVMGICINVGKMQLSFDKESIKPGIRTREDENLQPRTQTVIEGQINCVGPIITERFNFHPEVMVANSLSVARKNRVPVLLLNASDKIITLRKGTQVACFEPMKEPVPLTDAATINRVIRLTPHEEYVKIGDNLDEKQVNEIQAIIAENLEAFSLKGSLGQVKNYEHVIELMPGAKPYVEPMRRRAQFHIEETRKQVQSMLENGIIEESSSPWASAYVLARKKSGDYRLCVDFRRLNSMTKKCAYPLPHIESCLETLAGKKYFSQIDFASGFWQIPMEKSARELTAFRTEDGLFQFKRMPFGLTNAPASFQRLMDVTLSGLKGLNLQVFIDDICVATQSWEEHLRILSKLFKLVIEANLKIKAEKCVFGAQQITFLGHEVSIQGIKQEPAKLKAMTEMPRPRDVPELKRALGMFSYYRKFVPQFAIVAEPLTRLTRKKHKFEWGDEQDNAFKEIISQLKKNSTLAHFDPKKATLLKTDASRKGVAGIILQRHEEDWKIISCCSRRLTSSEENYGITDLEGLAVIWSIQKFRPYLLGIRFQVLVDHCALCVLNNRTPTSPRLKRWAIILSEFDFEIVYTKGSLHKDVDCLSRAPVDDPVDDYLESKVYLVTPLDAAEWICNYNDEESRRLFQEAYERKNNLKLVNDIIYKDGLLYVPRAKRDELIRVTHSAPMNGHPGINATKAKLSENYWWPKMLEDITRVIQLCGQCILNKPERRRPAGQMHSFEIYSAGEQIAIDCLGPLKESANGNVHVIVAIDVFTRFVETKAVPDIGAPTFSQFLIEYCGRFGIPYSILTDNSTTFSNEFVKEILKVFGANHLKATPYHSQGNGVVERVIQTIQEKLRLTLDDPIQEANWDAALPIATLAINTAFHQSIGCTPYELTYGRRPPFQDMLATCRATPQDTFAKMIQLHMKECAANAVAIQSLMQANAKERYDQQHRAIKYEVDDLVVVEQPPRSSKLASKYKGPYQIVNVKNDIYKIRDLDTNKITSRHVSKLKLYRKKNYNANQVNYCKKPTNRNMYWVLLVLSILNTATTQHTFEKVKPLIWLTTDYTVELGTAHYDINFAYMSPCYVFEKALRENPAVASRGDMGNETHRLSEDTLQRLETFRDECERLYSTEWLSVIDEFEYIETPSRKTPFVISNKMVRAVDRFDFANPAKIKHDILELEPLLVEPFALSRKKRGAVGNFVGSLAKDLLYQGIGMVAGNVVSNLISVVFERINPDSTYNRQAKLEEGFHKMKYNFDVLKEVAMGTIEQIEVLTETVRSTVKRMESLVQDFPRFVWIASVVANKILASGTDLRKVIDEAKTGHVAVYQVARLLNLPQLKQLKVEQTLFESVRRIDKNTINFRFTVSVLAPDTFVYQVAAFNHWDNLADIPEYLEYRGANYLIYNETANCIKAVDPPRHTTLHGEECTELDGEDPQLSKWVITRKTHDMGDTVNMSLVQKTLEYNYIYCFPGNITIGKETYRCPMEAFRLKSDKAFKTADRRHNPTKIQQNVTERHGIDAVHAGHFEDDSDTVNELRIFDKLKEFRSKLEAINTESIVLKRTTISWIIGGICASGLTAGIVYCCVVYQLYNCGCRLCVNNSQPIYPTYSMRPLNQPIYIEPSQHIYTETTMSRRR